MTTQPPAHRVVIVGGGFGGINAALRLRKTRVDVTLIDRRNFHLFQPLLYQVATGGLSPANIAAPLRAVFKRQKNVRVLLGDVVGIDAAHGAVILEDDSRVNYDSLILAAGSSHNYFGNEQWAPLAPGLKTVEDATDIRQRILMAFEAAERETDPAQIKAWLTFVVVGGGPTGVEMAGAIAEIANRTLKHEFRTIDPGDARVLLVEMMPTILGTYDPSLQKHAMRALEKLGVNILTERLVTDIGRYSVTLKHGENPPETIACRTVIWGAGVKASPLCKLLADASPQVELDRAGRVKVAPDCRVPGLQNVYAIGDMMALTDERTGKPLPGVAQTAIQQGKYVAEKILRELRGKPSKPFRYKDLGSMSTIGRSQAVAEIGDRVKLHGFLGWLAWLFIHLMYIVHFENRVLVLVQWAWNYFTWNRAARLITGEGTLPIEHGEIPPGAKSATKVLNIEQIPESLAMTVPVESDGSASGDGHRTASRESEPAKSDSHA